MQMKSILAGTAIALATSIGSASAGEKLYAGNDPSPASSPAAEQFIVLKGIKTELISNQEMKEIFGASTNITVSLEGDELFSIFLDADVQGAVFFSVDVDQELTGSFSNGLGTLICFQCTPQPVFSTP